MMCISGDKKFESLVRHYEDSFAQQLVHIRRRDRIFRVLLIILVVTLFQVLNGHDVYDDLIKVLTLKLKLEWSTAISKSFINVSFWVIFFAFSVRYYQVVVAVERGYNYIHKLEKEISCNFESQIPFTREGKWYSSGKPAILKYVHIAYIKVVPPVLVLCAVAKIIAEYEQSKIWWVSATLCLGTAVVLTHYIFFWRKSQKKKA